ncbi:MAG TPA: sigma-70 family RNA polymerase sigma factor [Actinomycetes bacterium]|nr:sigma-70 family RNA polymerase sigma factor [Actinomycetes bacterium]
MDGRPGDVQPGDAELVRAAVDGDRDAFAAIYDRYADRLHDFCHSLLRDREEAADATQDAFVTAAERLGQLHDPERLRPWLYAVARSQALARMRARRRTVAESEVSDMPDPAGGPADLAEQAEMRELVWSAATGLSERDRALLDLHLRHGLEGAELGEAMGVGSGHAYVLLSRLRDQVERSLGALLVARLGREDCAELRRLLTGWDGRFSPLIRKRVARHVDECELCAERRRTVASPLSLLAAVPLVPAPAELRERVLERVELTGGRGGTRRPRGWMLAAALLGAAALLAVPGGLLLAGGSDPVEPELPATTVASAPAAPPGTSGSTVPPSSAPAPSSTASSAAAGATTITTTAPPAPGVLDVTPALIDLGADQDSATLLLRNSGGAALAWSATAGASWLRVDPAQGRLDGGGQTRLAVGADRTGLPEGTAASAVQLSWPGGSIQVRVQVAVEHPPRIGERTATPSQIEVSGSGCAGSTALVQAAVDDESGLAAVVLEWGDGPSRVPMAQRSGTWFARLGPVPEPGMVPWRIVATDTRGNTATADGTPVVAVRCVT